jgi:ABC-type uncharacterized transport system permease subunit
MAQRMSTSRAVRPAALEALLVMMLLALFWVWSLMYRSVVGVEVEGSGKV